jgi:hypothetical protein
MDRHERTLVNVPDLPVNFLGTERCHVLLQLAGDSYTKDDIFRAFHELSGFPLLSNDHDRLMYLKVCSVSHELDEIGGVKNSLSIIGDHVISHHSRRVFDVFCVHHDIGNKIAEKLLQTLRDQERHSAILGFSEGQNLIMVAVNTWPGRFEEVVTDTRDEVFRLANI